MKVFSKKKAADRTQHNLRTFSVPLRPSSSSPSPSALPTPAGADTVTGGTLSGDVGGAGGVAGGGGTPNTSSSIVKITVPANLPIDTGDVVERLKCSVMAFKQVWTRVLRMQDSGACVVCDLNVVSTLGTAFGGRHRSSPSRGLGLAGSAHVQAIGLSNWSNWSN